MALVNLCKAATYGAAALSALTVGCSLVANGPAPTPLLLLAVLLPLWTGLFLSKLCFHHFQAEDALEGVVYQV